MSFCLSKLKYNEKSLRVLTDKFECYRDKLKDQ